MKKIATIFDTFVDGAKRYSTCRTMFAGLFAVGALALGACTDDDNALVDDPDPENPDEPVNPDPEPGTDPDKTLREDATPLFFDAAMASGIGAVEIEGEPNGYTLTIDADGGKCFIPTAGLKEPLENRRVKLVFEYRSSEDISAFNLGFSQESEMAYYGKIETDVDRYEDGWAPYSVSLVNDVDRCQWGEAGDWLGFYLHPSAASGTVTFEIRDIYLEETDEPVDPVEPDDPNKYPLSFTIDRAATPFEAKFGRSDGIEYTRTGDEYHVVFVESNGNPDLAHNEHMFATDPLTRILYVNDNQKVELVFKYKAATNYPWQFTTMFQVNENLDVFNKTTVDCQTMKASADAEPDSEGWATYRHDLTAAVNAVKWGQDPTASPQIRFRFRLTRSGEITDPAHPEHYDFKEIYLKDICLQISDKGETPEPGPGPVDPDPVVPDPERVNEVKISFTAGRDLFDFESRFKAVGVLFDYVTGDDCYHFQLDESSDHRQHVVFSDVLESALNIADLSSDNVEIVFKYKARVDGSVSNPEEWYNRWFFKIMPVVDKMTATEYNEAVNAQEVGGAQTDNFKFGTDAAPMEWTEYRMQLNSSLASKPILNSWGTDLTKHPQLRLDFRARNTNNNDCPAKSLGLTDVWIKDLQITVNAEAK